MKEQSKNGYEDDDFQQIIDEIEGLKADRRSILAEAAGKSSAIAKKIADAKKTAKALNIPKPVLDVVLKQRDCERKLQELAESVPEDLVEVYADAAGQFSFLKPVDDEVVVTPAETAARQAKQAAQKRQEEEQEEGAKVLDELTSGVTH